MVVGSVHAAIWKRRLKHAGNVGVQCLCVVWIVLQINVWGFQQSWRHDYTRDKRYEVTPEATSVLQQLTPERKIRVVVPLQRKPGVPGELTNNLLNRGIRLLREYEQVSPNFHLEKVISVGRDPSAWEQLDPAFGVDAPNRIYLLCGDARESLGVDDLARIQAPGPATPNVPIRILSEHVGEALTAALQRLVVQDRPVVYVTEGHGEIALGEPRELASFERFFRALRQRGFEVRTLDLLLSPEIPEDARAVITIGGGGRGFDTFGAVPARAIERYVRDGGSYLLFLPTRARVGIEELLDEAGIEAKSREFVATRSSGERGREVDTTLVYSMEFSPEHPITSEFDWRRFRAIVEDAHPLEVSERNRADAILRSPANTWLEEHPQYIRRDLEDGNGPFALAVAGSVPRGALESPGKIVVFGAWKMARDDYWHVSENRQLVLNSVYWLTDRNFTAASGRDVEIDRIVLDARLLTAVFWTTVVAMPFAALLLGLGVFSVRSWRSG